MKLLEDEMGCENLTPAKSIIKQVYTDTKIIKGTRKLARSSKVDLENISNEVFLKMLQEMWDGIDLTPKKDLVFKTLEEYKRKHHVRVNNAMHTSDVLTSPTINVTKPNTLQNADEVMAMAMNYTSPDNNNRNPTTIVGKPKCSLDLEEGCKVPEAAGLKWTDDFFDDDADDLVAVFDRKFMHMDATLNISSDVFIFLFSSQLSCTDDYDKMIQYGMTIIIANEIFPVFMIILGFVILTLYLKSLAGVFLLVLDLICLGLSLYGSYRVTNSYVRSLHLAVKRDGICFVQDNHLESFSLVAACRCCDSIYKVSKRSHTIPFDQITDITVKDPGELNKTGCCWLRVPFYIVAIDTASSDPEYYAKATMGLCLPHEFQKLVWAMKRHKGEEILRRTEKNTAAMCSAMMFDNMMKYGMSPVQPPVPGTIGGSGNTAPTMSVSTASTPSYDTTDDHPCH
ncbi:hypothetical protein ACHAXS_010024 [Conticribra weissflogii]